MIRYAEQRKPGIILQLIYTAKRNLRWRLPRVFIIGALSRQCNLAASSGFTPQPERRTAAPLEPTRPPEPHDITETIDVSDVTKARPTCGSHCATVQTLAMGPPSVNGVSSAARLHCNDGHRMMLANGPHVGNLERPDSTCVIPEHFKHVFPK